MSIPSKHELIDFIRGELQRFAAHGVPLLDAVNAELRKVFLRQISETPDNLASIANLELGSVAAVDGRQTFGLTVRGTQLLISDVLWRPWTPTPVPPSSWRSFRSSRSPRQKRCCACA